MKISLGRYNSKRSARYRTGETGQTIVEVLVTAGLIAMIFPVLAQGFTLSRGSAVNREARQDALLLMQESLDAIKTIRETGWSQIATNGTYHPALSGDNWTLVSGNEQIGNYTRSLVIDDVERDSNGDIIAIGGTVDPSTKKVTHLISWQTPTSGQIEYVTYITRYLDNSVFLETTTTDFSSGTFANTEVTAAINDGAVILTAPQTANSFLDEYNTPSDYTYDPAKIEVTGGYAQLLLPTESLDYTTSNSGFDVGIGGWTFLYDSNMGQSGSYLSSGGNPGGFARIDYPSTKNKSSNSYYEQPLTVASNGAGGYLQFDWKVTTYTGTPTSFILYAWLDTSSGGTPSNQIWSSGEQTAVTSWSSTVTADVTSTISTSGTYYLKVGGYISYPKSPNQGPFQFGYDNVLLSWSEPPAGYPMDSPDIVPNNSFQALLVNSWTSFSTTEVANGGSITYQLSDDDGSTWYYYEGPPTRAWVATAVSSNDAATINSNISTFSAANDQILVKAFLTSDGTQFVRLDNVTIGYNGLVDVNTGNYTSSSKDAGQEVSYNYIEYTDYNTANTTTLIQIATNNDDSTWNYFGPDGTAGTYYTTGNGQIPLSYNLGRYFRYKVYFESNTTDQPYLEDILVNYSP